MGPRILLDTNILLDYLLCREPYEQIIQKNIVIACKQKQVSACIAAHSISNMFFILRKAFSIKERRSLLYNLCELFEVEGIDKAKIFLCDKMGMQEGKFVYFFDAGTGQDVKLCGKADWRRVSLCSMEKDGTNHREITTVYEIMGNDFVAPSGFIHRNYFYYIVSAD